ncbi:hypothetical protein HDZ31DRAFT_79200 [Schizophyllum fasciatum]
MGHRNITIDDRNTTIIQYSNTWFITGTYNASATGESGTLSSTDDANANLTFVFPQPAVAFYYFGMKRSGGGLYKICIDCDPNDRVFADVDAYNATDDGHNPPAVLYSRQWDTPTTHEVILQNSEDDRFGVKATQITVDRFVLTVLDDNVDDPTSTSTGASSTSRASSTSAQASNTAGAAASGKNNDAGVIAGSVVGSIAFLAIGSALLWWFFRGRRRAPARGGSESGLLHPEPFVQPPNGPLTYPAPYPPHHPAMATVPFDGRALHAYLSEKQLPSVVVPAMASQTDVQGSPTRTQGSSFARGSSHEAPVGSASSATSPVDQASNGLPGSTRTGASSRRREVDAGPAPEISEEPYEDLLPPDYDDATRHRQGR